LATRRQENKQRAQTAILEAAAHLLASQSLEATTTREIAKQAGVSYQTLYNYFPTKAKIIHALMNEDLTAWGITIDGVIKQYSGDLIGTLVTIHQIGMREVSGEKIELWRAISLEYFNLNEDQEQISSLNQIAHERYHALLKMAQGMGHLAAEVDIHLLAHTLFCLSDHNLLTFAFGKTHDEKVNLETLHQQLQLLLTPYLRRPTQR